MIYRILIALALLSPALASAATIEIAHTAAPIGVGDSFVATITLDAKDENINALEGDIVYPSDLLAVREIRDGNSIVNLWITRPIATSVAIHFAGITPGGYSGSSGELFSIVFEAKKSGTAHIGMQEARALL